jgi:hypothetical protein
MTAPRGTGVARGIVRPGQPAADAAAVQTPPRFVSRADAMFGDRPRRRSARRAAPSAGSGRTPTSNGRLEEVAPILRDVLGDRLSE